MSRISRYITRDENYIKRMIWNVAFYLRLSREDDGEKDESESISNQKLLMEKFIKENPDINVVDFYIDDGYSGTTFERPAFKRMWQDILSGKVNCVVVKDLSRFGRNLIETGNYIEIMFPLMKIRFISLLEYVDSFLNPDSVNNLMVAFKNIMNDEVARENSVKVRTAQKSFRQRGLYLGGFAPYGYIRNSEDTHKLLVDKEAAEVVKIIFQLYIEGFTMSGICKYLNDKEIPIPLDYKKSIGLNFKSPSKNNLHSWSPTTIKTILENEMYIGNMVQGKRRVLSFRNHKKIDIPKEEWDIVPNTHEAIISIEDFEKVQILLKNNAKQHRKSFRTYILSGLVRCGDCGSAMTTQLCSSKNLKDKYYFKCHNYTKYNKLCSKHSIRNDVLENMVFEIVKKYIDLSLDIEEYLKKEQNVKMKMEITPKVQLKNKKENELNSLKQRLNNLYLNLKSKIISEEEYINQKKNIEDNIESLKNQIVTLSALLNNSTEVAHNTFVTTFKKYKGFNSLTKEMANELINKIEIFEDKHIEIDFKFKDEFEAVVNYLDQKTQI